MSDDAPAVKSACPCASEVSAVEALARDVLALYSRAVELKQFDAAEALLQCLETLANNAPIVAKLRDEAYMRIAQGS